MTWRGRWDSKEAGLGAWMRRRVLQSLGFLQEEAQLSPGSTHIDCPCLLFPAGAGQEPC